MAQNVSSRVKQALSCLILALVCSSFAGEKHFIGHSWDLLKVTTDDLVRNRSKLEKLPLSGISISLSAKSADGKRTVYTRDILSDPAWNRKNYRGEIENIKKISSGKLKHNFLLTNLAPKKRLKWTDDAAWENAAHNAAVLAWVARNSGVKGIMIDPEDYYKTKQFKHFPDDPPYGKTAALARKRGAQIMKAMAGEYPDIVLLSFYFLGGSFKTGDPNLQTDVKLKVPFIDGMLDELPPGAQMVDATEMGYACSAANHNFYQLAWNILWKAGKLLSPENRIKLQQYQVGFGLYLDMYTDPESREWSHPATDGSRLTTLFNDFSEAMTCADQYCWIYGEKFSWIKWDCADRLLKSPPRHMKIKPETWEEKLPGFSKALTFIAKGEKAYQEAYDNLVKKHRLVNRIRNPKCLPGKKVKTTAPAAGDWDTGSLPPGWYFWSANRKEGSFGLDTKVGMDDSFSVTVTGKNNAAFIHNVKVKPGQIYACEAFKKGGKDSRLSIRWRKGGKWVVAMKYDVAIPFSGKPDKRGWQKAFGFVKVPPEADTLVFLIGTNLKPNETAWYDNPCVSLITPEDLP